MAAAERDGTVSERLTAAINNRYGNDQAGLP